MEKEEKNSFGSLFDKWLFWLQNHSFVIIVITFSLIILRKSMGVSP